MKRALAFLAILVITLLLFVTVFVKYADEDKETVYVGVTYCGNSVEEGKLLIDKVKHYTNLFVLQSGILQRDFGSVNELGDYAVSAGMYFLPYFGHYIEETFMVWLEEAKTKWGNQFLGVYLRDESGGKMLDDYVEFKNATTGDSVMKTRYGDVVLERANGTIVHYQLDGVIHLSLPYTNKNGGSTNGTETGTYATFYPDGRIEVDETNASAAAIQIAELPDYANYEDLSALHPLRDLQEAADSFIERYRPSVEYLSNSTTVFSSDYALYWFDYLAGYDVMLVHLGWNHSVPQHVGLLRGAARLQNKDWGVVVTWKYTIPPYLDTAENILDQMTTSYECGARYFVLFNYYFDGSGPYGMLTDEHFEVMKSFWNDVVKNPEVVHGSVEADSVLVLPENYGWGMRSPEDKIWGIFKPDNQTQQIMELTESVLAEHGLETDIVYEDTNFPLPSNYQHIYYWNQK